VEGAHDPLQPQLFGTDAELHRVYDAGGNKVYLHIGYYAQQRHGAEAVSSQHQLTKTGVEIPNAAGKATATLADGSLSINYVRFPLNHGGRLIWYWYWVDGRFTGNPYWAKFLQLKAKLLRGPQAAAVILVETDYRETPDEAEQRLAAFLAQMPGLRHALTVAGEK
jgi:EpsI family protein